MPTKSDVADTLAYENNWINVAHSWTALVDVMHGTYALVRTVTDGMTIAIFVYLDEAEK